MAALLAITIPSLATCNGGFSPNTMASCTSISCTGLTTITGGIGPSSMAALATLNLPALTNMSTVSITSAAGTANVQSVTLGPSTGIAKIGNTITITGQKLTASVVNRLLVTLVNSFNTDGTTPWNGTVNVSGGTSAAPDTTSGGFNGSAAKTTLQGRGATVTTN